MHIGLIGGIGPAATEFYYRKLIDAHKLAGQPLDLTIVNAETTALVQNMEDGAPEKQVATYLKLAKRLHAAGAEAMVISSIGGHFCVKEFEPVSPLPLIKIIPALKAELTNKNLKRIGLLGSRVSMATKLYGGIEGIEIVVPPGNDLDAVHDAYITMAGVGSVTQQQRELFFNMGKTLCEEQGAEAIVLSGTDLFLAFDGQDCGFTTIDSALAHINAILKASLGAAAEGVLYETRLNQ
ncbi:MAG: aspartate/glutamate racemase family protein [Pseudomonadota bacterium]